MRDKYYSRKFLNKDKGTAMVETSISHGVEWVDGAAAISDCNRMVRLDFSFHNPKEKRRSLAKLRLLIDELVKFEDALKESSV